MTNQIVIMEVPRHILVIATSYKVKILRRFLSYVAHVKSFKHTFCDVFCIDYDENWVSQISDNRIIVIRFMKKEYVFVVEYFLLHGIGDEPIFVM